MYCYQQNSQEATKWKSQVEKCSQFSHYVDYAIKHTKQFMCFHYFVFLLLKKKKKMKKTWKKHPIYLGHSSNGGREKWEFKNGKSRHQKTPKRKVSNFVLEILRYIWKGSNLHTMSPNWKLKFKTLLIPEDFNLLTAAVCDLLWSQELPPWVNLLPWQSHSHQQLLQTMAEQSQATEVIQKFLT